MVYLLLAVMAQPQVIGSIKKHEKLNSIVMIYLMILCMQAKGQQNQIKPCIDETEAGVNQSKQPQIIDARSPDEFAQIPKKCYRLKHRFRSSFIFIKSKVLII
ncbi:MAG: hypothetical protein JWP78_697 [Mucilaginibacter sp.]|nr:hypothetical protein [Mucilaginibacter sp.]